MKEYRFRWQTWVGISLLLLLIFTVCLPDPQLQLEDSESISRFSLARWALNVDDDYDFSTLHISDDALSNSEIVSFFRLWGWMIYLPFLCAVISVIFMIVWRKTLSGLLLFNGVFAVMGECLIQWMIPSGLWEDGREVGAVFVLILVLSCLVVIYGILCMTVWIPKKNRKQSTNKYDYVFQEAPAIIDSIQQTPKTSIRPFGILKGIRGEYANQTLEIHPGEEIVLGRDPQYCMLVFRNQGVSRRQCGIRYNGLNGYYQAIDYSSNGTTLSDGTLLTTSEYTSIKPGTVLYIANGSESLVLM